MPTSNRIRQFRETLKDRFGADFGVRGVSERAGISERAWWSYERGEAMPPADSAVAIARVLGLTVEQLAFRRDGVAPPAEDATQPPAPIPFPSDGYQCAGGMRAGAYINKCPLPGGLHTMRWSRGRDASGERRTIGAVALGLCPLHAEQMSFENDYPPDIERLAPSLDMVTASHPLADELDLSGDWPTWTNVGIPPRTRKFFKPRRGVASN